MNSHKNHAASRNQLYTEMTINKQTMLYTVGIEMTILEMWVIVCGM
jgi:hypothetical protein